jgi:hypothetical protein
MADQKRNPEDQQAHIARIREQQRLLRLEELQLLLHNVVSDIDKARPKPEEIKRRMKEHNLQGAPPGAMFETLQEKESREELYKKRDKILRQIEDLHLQQRDEADCVLVPSKKEDRAERQRRHAKEQQKIKLEEEKMQRLDARMKAEEQREAEEQRQAEEQRRNEERAQRREEERAQRREAKRQAEEQKRQAEEQRQAEGIDSIVKEAIRKRQEQMDEDKGCIAMGKSHRFYGSTRYAPSRHY